MILVLVCDGIYFLAKMLLVNQSAKHVFVFGVYLYLKFLTLWTILLFFYLTMQLTVKLLLIAKLLLLLLFSSSKRDGLTIEV